MFREFRIAIYSVTLAVSLSVILANNVIGIVHYQGYGPVGHVVAAARHVR